MTRAGLAGPMGRNTRGKFLGFDGSDESRYREDCVFEQHVMASIRGKVWYDFAK